MVLLRRNHQRPIKDPLYGRIFRYMGSADSKSPYFRALALINCHNAQYVNPMGQIMRVALRWNGFVGAPGYSNFYFGHFDRSINIDDADAADACDRVNAFVASIKSLLPNVVQLQVEDECGVLDETNGNLLAVVNGDSGGPQNGTAGTGGYGAASGAVVSWRTARVRNNRRIRGRTFIVPLYSSKYGADGSLDGATSTTLSGAANTLWDNVSDLDLGVWARSNNDLFPNGEWAPVTSCNVPDMNAVLRSRRD